MKILPFDRSFFDSGRTFSRIGKGEIGGKARGLALAAKLLTTEFDRSACGEFQVDIPRFVVLGTDVFDSFLDQNDLCETALSDLPDDRIAHAFVKADLPTEILGDLRALTEEVRTPLAIRSSSLLEDALAHPFAGIYETKMTANNQTSPLDRFRRLAEAVKLVYASTFFRSAKNYIRAIRRENTDEKMAVVIQEVVGSRYGDRFYPTLSGVCRSYNFYPIGGSKPEDGVVDLALGLGKTIVDGGLAHVYSPTRPKAPPPAGSPGDRMKLSQKNFWAVNIGKPPPHNPIAETEYLTQEELAKADYDGTLRYTCSTYIPSSDRFSPGAGAQGPRVIDFAPLLVLEELPLNRVIQELLAACERSLKSPVEIEFAVTLPGKRDTSAPRFGFLQVRPMAVSGERVEIADAEMAGPRVLLASNKVMGNGKVNSVRDVVYVRPDTFEARHTRAVAQELELMNRPLLEKGLPYLLIGFGRWGSSDPWLGIPVDWGQISGARTIVEATLPSMTVEASQGSHFFHNITSFNVCYFTASHLRGEDVDWSRLGGLPAETETEFLRHVRLKEPLLIKVDGRRSRGVILYGEGGTPE